MKPPISPATALAYIDLLTLTLVGFVAFAILMVLPKDQQAATDENRPPGMISVEIRWPDGLDTDVDLWVLAPQDRPVGYSNRSARFFDLLRDDLGFSNDGLDLNYENAYTRGAPDGEYVVNLHLYSNLSGVLPIPVTMEVRGHDARSSRSLWSGAAVLERAGQEITVLRFTLDGARIEVHAPTFFTALRSPSQGGYLR
jgi:hypothetical protein